MSDEKPTQSLIKLDGTIIKSDGSKYKSDFFKFLELNPDDYSDISYTPEEAHRVRAHLLHLSTGASAAVPMICGGIAKCPMQARCPFIRIDKARIAAEGPGCKKVTPVGRSCLVEIELLNEWTRLYLHEYDVAENAFTEIQMCREMAEIELMLWRINNGLAKPENAELVQDVTVGIDKEGNALTRKETSALFEAKERLQTRKSRMIKLMVGDRQEKYKREAALKVRDVSDASSDSARLRGHLQRLLNKAKEVDLKLKEAEGNIIEAEVAGQATDDSPLTPEDLIAGESSGE